jgi:hypothetical protein
VKTMQSKGHRGEGSSGPKSNYEPGFMVAALDACFQLGAISDNHGWCPFAGMPPFARLLNNKFNLRSNARAFLLVMNKLKSLE